MLQAPGFEGLSLNLLSMSQKGFVTPEVDVGGCDVVQALMVAPVIVMIDEGLDLGFKIKRQEVVFQQDAVLQSLMPPFDFALCLRMIRGSSAVLHALVLKPFGQIARDVT